MPASCVYQSIRKRRSVRSFAQGNIKGRLVYQILDAGRWAPSGLNNQPWRFVIVRKPSLKSKIACCSEYAHTIRRADCVLLIFLDRKNSYHHLKDAQAIGACIQNMLLCAFELGIGTCWMGEILNQKQKVNKLCALPPRYELMAVLALGYPQRKTKSTLRLRSGLSLDFARDSSRNPERSEGILRRRSLAPPNVSKRITLKRLILKEYR